MKTMQIETRIKSKKKLVIQSILSYTGITYIDVNPTYFPCFTGSLLVFSRK